MNSHCAVLVIDMQLVAFDGEVTPPIVDGDRVLAAVKTLIDAARAASSNIVFVQTSALSGRPYARDVHGWHIHPELNQQPTDSVVFKQHSSGFDGTNLQEVLVALEIDTLIACGIWREHCVTNTAADALALGYRVVVAADAHGTVAATAAAASTVVEQCNVRLAQQGGCIMPVSELSIALGAA